MNIVVRPFSIPRFAVLELPSTSAKFRVNEDEPNVEVALEDISADEIESLCVRFREGVFKAAMREDPAIERPRMAAKCPKCGETF